MRTAANYSASFGPDGPVLECDNFTCQHCQRIVFVQPKQAAPDMGGLCKQCMGLICPRCYEARVCIPWEKEMARREASAGARRSYGMT